MLAVLAGLWLVVAPAVADYGVVDRGSAGFWNAVATGGLIALVAAARARRPMGALVLRWAGVVLGGWLLIAPAALGVVQVDRVVAGEMAVGLVAAALAVVGLRAAILACRIR